MNKVKTIISKEWAEVFKNRLVLFSVAFLPLIFVALPLITVGALGDAGNSDIPVTLDSANALPGYDEVCVEMSLTEGECLQIYMLDLFTLLFMILPVMIPVTIAAYSIVGEKTARSLEPLLATPITTVELILGKSLAAIIPAVAATWLGYLVYAVGMKILLESDIVFMRLFDPIWLIAVFVLGPLLTIFAVCVAIMVSSRVTDPRVAEQLAGVIVLPLVLIMTGQSIGFFLVNRAMVIVAAAVVAVLDVGFVYLAVHTFERENILTRWK
ncbi:MAG: ABC transporter permease subunit [Candidatus Promineifilaceae bacterium]